MLPTITNTGIGGKSAGAYDLKINFKPDLTQSQQLVDKERKVALDGDADGVAGGAYNFWFRAQTVANTIIVDKANTQSGNGVGTIANPYKNISTALAAATLAGGSRIAFSSAGFAASFFFGAKRSASSRGAAAHGTTGRGGGGGG